MKLKLPIDMVLIMLIKLRRTKLPKGRKPFICTKFIRIYDMILNIQQNLISSGRAHMVRVERKICE